MQLAFIVCFATELFHGASSHLVPNAIVTTPIEEDRAVQKYKRDANAQRQCVSNRLDATFQGNTSNFVSLCKSVAVGPQIDPSNPTSAQAQIIPIYRIYCISECGTAINDAYRVCGVYSSVPPGSEAFNVGLCGTNEDGNQCYQLYGDGLTIQRTEASCYNTYISMGVCTCQIALTEAVQRQGCCLDGYHDFLLGLGPSAPYSPSVLYNACNVNRPAGCNNSTIAASDSSNSTSIDSSSPTSIDSSSPTSIDSSSPTSIDSSSPTSIDSSSPTSIDTTIIIVTAVVSISMLTAN